jgi:hypothetical protein
MAKSTIFLFSMVLLRKVIEDTLCGIARSPARKVRNSPAVWMCLEGISLYSAPAKQERPHV